MTNPFTKKSAAPAASKPDAATFARPGEEKEEAPKRDAFARPSGGGDGAAIKADLGSLLVVRPTEFLEGFSTSVGTGDVIRADWLVCDGENAGEVREEGLVFNKPLVRDLKKHVGGLFVGRLTMGAKEIKGNKPYIFQDFTDEEEALARDCAKAVGWI